MPCCILPCFGKQETVLPTKKAQKAAPKINVKNKINPSKASIKPLKDHAASKISTDLFNYTKAGCSYIIVLAKRIAAYIVSIFGDCGKKLSTKWHKSADLYHILHVQHTLADIKFPPLPLSRLVASKNIPQKNVLKLKEDRKMVLEYKKILLQPDFTSIHQIPQFEAEFIEKLKTYELTTYQSHGICFGISLLFYKSVLELNKQPTEQELCTIAKTFEKGGSAQASALQGIYSKVFEWSPELHENDRKLILDQLEPELEKIKKENNELLNALSQNNMTPEERLKVAEDLFAKQTNKIKEFCENKEKEIIAQMKFAQKAHKVAAMARIVSLRLVDYSKNDKDPFFKMINEKPYGTYQISYMNEKGAHAMVYINTTHGKYLFDPNFGLLIFNENTPADNLKLIFDLYVKSMKSSKYTLGLFQYNT